MRKKSSIFIFLIVILLSSCSHISPENPESRDELRIAATIFPAYDFARAAAGDLGHVTLLLPPGAESHSYEPTPADILAVQDCDLFLYLGGESDAWVETILEAVRPGGAVLRMMDCVELLEEEEEGEHHHHHEEGEVEELDEHVWTDPKNAAAITRAAGEALAALDPANAAAYRESAESYAGQLEELDVEFSAFFAENGYKTMVFGDRFPFRYFAEAYDLDCRAAFPGCGTQTEPSAAVMAYLMDKVKEENLSTVWYIEFSNHLVADAVAEASGAETALFHSCHNVSQAELDAGVTYLTLMEGNLETLRTRMP